MSINSLDNYISSAKQKIRYVKNTSVTTIANQFWTLWNGPGDPGAGSLGAIQFVANGSTNGRVCNYSIAGFPSIRPFGADTTGYLTGFDYSNTVAGRYMICDRIWECGNIDPSTKTGTSDFPVYTITANPSSYQYRVPSLLNGNKDWSTLELWMEVSTAFTAQAMTLSVGYINESNVGGRYTPVTTTLSGFTTGRCVNLPLQAGDKGIIAVTDVSMQGAKLTSGTFNLFLARPLYVNPRVNIANYSDVHGFEKVGMPVIDASAALTVMFAADSTASGVVDCLLEICNG